MCDQAEMFEIRIKANHLLQMACTLRSAQWCIGREVLNIIYLHDRDCARLHGVRGLTKVLLNDGRHL